MVMSLKCGKNPEEHPNLPRPGLLLGGGSSNGKQRRDVWETFVRTGHIDDPTLPQPIAASWQRCRDMGVDPLSPRCCEFTPMAQIEPLADTIYAELAADVERQIYDQIKQRGLLITVADAEGRILRTCGSKEVLLEADRLHFGPGAVWSELSVGTDAISLSINDGTPAQVMGVGRTASRAISGALFGDIRFSRHLATCGTALIFPAPPAPTTAMPCGWSWALPARLSTPSAQRLAGQYGKQVAQPFEHPVQFHAHRHTYGG